MLEFLSGNKFDNIYLLRSGDTLGVSGSFWFDLQSNSLLRPNFIDNLSLDLEDFCLFEGVVKVTERSISLIR